MENDLKCDAMINNETGDAQDTKWKAAGPNHSAKPPLGVMALQRGAVHSSTLIKDGIGDADCFRGN